MQTNKFSEKICIHDDCVCKHEKIELTHNLVKIYEYIILYKKSWFFLHFNKNEKKFECVYLVSLPINILATCTQNVILYNRSHNNIHKNYVCMLCGGSFYCFTIKTMNIFTLQAETNKMLLLFEKFLLAHTSHITHIQAKYL